jgi:hypothetical protein
MTPLVLQSEAYRPEGGIDARSQRRTLGRPDLDPDLFLRETLQNSWDARIEGSGAVQFSINAWHTTAAQMVVLRNIVFQNTPTGSGLARVLNADNIDVLVVTDTGTQGLTGPTRADIATNGESNFVDLVRNTGRDIRKGFAGGTYGFGKAVLFQASACSTVVIFSRTTVDRRPMSRFIAMALDHPYDNAGQRYTGRHWWGTAGGLVEPVEGAAADELATALGLTDLPVGTTGTAIMVLAPSSGDVALRDLVAQLAESATAYAWPHMVSIATRSPDIIFSFACDAERITPPDPTIQPRLRHFVEAYRRCEDLLAGRDGPASPWPWTVEEIRSQRPQRRLGALAYRDYPHTPDGDHDAAPSEVALMRGPRLVVRYQPVKAAPSGQATAGVFISCPQLEEDFAKSEPASHDEWRPANLGLTPNQRNPVRQTLEQVKVRFRRHTTPVSATQASHHPGTVSLASRLGRLLDGTIVGTDPRIPALPSSGGTTGADSSNAPPRNHRSDKDEVQDPSSTDASGTSATVAGSHHTRSSGVRDDPVRRRTSSRRPRVWLGQTARIVVLDDATAVEFVAEVVIPEEGHGAVITAVPYVLVDGGRENDPPAGADVPDVISWREVATGEIRHGPVLTLSRPGNSSWRITVSQPADAAVSLRLETKETAA